MLTSGIAIAERRREKIAKELKEYQACLDNIQNKLDMTSELEEGIVEELTEQDIKRSTVSLFTASVQLCSKILPSDVSWKWIHHIERFSHPDLIRFTLSGENRSKAHVPKQNVPKPRPAFTPDELAALTHIKTEGRSDFLINID